MIYRFTFSGALVLLLALSVSASLLARRAKLKAKTAILRYEGTLADDKGSPMSGVFQIRFALYDRIKDGRALWQHANYVFVHEGRYTVDLGKRQRLARKILGRTELFLGIKVGEGTEYREKLSLPAPRRETITTKTPLPPSSGVVQFAMRSGTADALSGMTLPQLITKLRQELRSPSGPGSHYYQMPQPLGNISQINCRSGYVLTGIVLRDGKISKVRCSLR